MSEPIQHTNRKGDCYTLFEGKTKTGKPKYFASRKPSSRGEPIDRIPDGYEIYENPNAVVSVRRVRPRLITDEEEALIRQLAERHNRVSLSRVEVERHRIVIYTPECGHFTAMFRFTLEDKQERLFLVERYCFRGLIDDWIHLDGPSQLLQLAKKFIPHLGQESFYDLI